MGSRRVLPWIARAMCVAALLTGGAAAEPATPRRGGTLVYAVIGDPPTYDCHGGTSFAVLQYVAPSLQFASGLLILHEPFDHARAIGFVVIWTALILYAGEGMRLSRRQHARTVTA